MIHGNLQHAHVGGGMTHFEFIAFAFYVIAFENERNDLSTSAFFNGHPLNLITSANEVTCFEKVVDLQFVSQFRAFSHLDLKSAKIFIAQWQKKTCLIEFFNYSYMSSISQD